MKKTLTLTMLFFVLSSAFAQSPPLTKAVLDEFSINLNYFHRHNDAMKSFLFYSIRQQNPIYSPTDVAIMVENVALNRESQTAIFKAFYNRCSGRIDCIEAEFMGLEMKASASRTLAQYVVANSEKGAEKPAGKPMSSDNGPAKHLNNVFNLTLDLRGRRFIKFEFPPEQIKLQGRVSARVSVDRNGKVLNAIPGVKGTTLSDEKVWDKFRTALLNATFNKLESAPELQTGTVVISFRQE